MSDLDNENDVEEETKTNNKLNHSYSHNTENQKNSTTPRKLSVLPSGVSRYNFMSSFG